MGDLPFVPPILVLAPHPDDESLGCGALLAECFARGHAAHVVCLTDGGASHPGSIDYPPARLAALRRAEIGRAIGRLGGVPERDLTWLGLPDAASHRIAGPGQCLISSLDRIVRQRRVRTLISPSPHDAHCDHEAAAGAARRLAAMHGDLDLAFYPVWSRWADPRRAAPRAGGERIVFERPVWRTRKSRAIAAHRSQLGRLIRDAPQAFSLPAGFAEFFAEAPEIYDRTLR